ncbi:60S ribosomal protein L5 [Thelohanellus kitauei]|uniref:60S ribosomal protein L5 n=1 Tax=Thelohanellus kitauei TaxID=669202 RepID=A0A0C2I8D3_THEKT|nr:60S ribosomal protein L5 [Thelohanellus kitauei]
MPIHKILKNRAYFKRYQVKFRRRREAKTDYYQRKRLIFQPKDRYNSRKYRLIVRFTNQYVICQIAYATIAGDVIVCQANSKELAAYGIKVGLKNYAAAYATGLLVARRQLQKLGLAGLHQGVTDHEKVGEDVNNEEYIDDKRPFKVVLDIGLARSTSGAKVFGAMKGALDGGLNIPHDPKRFVGNIKGCEEYKPEVHRDHIFGVHVAKYMEKLSAENPEAYKRQFSDFIKEGITHDKVEEMYRKAHEKIREEPLSAPKPERKKVEKAKLVGKEARKAALKAIADRHKRVTLKKQMLLQQITA